MVSILRPILRHPIDPYFVAPPTESRIDTTALLMGGFNIHVPVTSDDGESWFARAKLSQLTASLGHALINRKTPTLTFLCTAGLFMQPVFGSQPHSQTSPDTPYIVHGRAPGTPRAFQTLAEDVKQISTLR